MQAMTPIAIYLLDQVSYFFYLTSGTCILVTVEVIFPKLIIKLMIDIKKMWKDNETPNMLFGLDLNKSVKEFIKVLFPNNNLY